MSRLLRTVAMAGIAVSLAATGMTAVALAQDGIAAIKERQTAMRTVSKANVAIRNFLEKGEGSSDSVAAAATQIAAVADRIPGLFPKGTDEAGGAAAKSRAKAEIWTNRAAFEKTAASLKASATALAEVAKSGDKDKIKVAFATMGKNCGGCHKPFRGPERK